jgi:hypothetical protein
LPNFSLEYASTMLLLGRFNATISFSSSLPSPYREVIYL